VKLLITGICGFVGSSLALELRRRIEGLEVFGIDNLSRAGSELNRDFLQKQGIRFVHADLRNPSDIASLPGAEWVIDAAANPSVLAGITGATSSRQLMEHNLFGTVHLLEYCKQHRAGLVLLSTSRVYSQARLAALPMQTKDRGFIPRVSEIREPGISALGVAENFSTEPPLSLYGAAKLASEVLSLEYGKAFDFPVHINRCGVLAGAGQFGKVDQGIFAFWIHSYRNKRPLKFIGFDGAGHQVRDCLHPRDLGSLIGQQLRGSRTGTKVWNVGGGVANARSLAQVSQWCAERFSPWSIGTDLTPRPFDIPWLVLDSSMAAVDWKWKPATSVEAILEEIALHAEQHPDWLERSINT
jgi:CDP-paratose 2-epimerase